MDPTSGSRPARTFRGSRRRMRRIKMRQSGTWEIWLLVVWIVFLLLVVIPWMVRQNL
jgi:hypothetical protein